MGAAPRRRKGLQRPAQLARTCFITLGEVSSEVSKFPATGRERPFRMVPPEAGAAGRDDLRRCSHLKPYGGAGAMTPNEGSGLRHARPDPAGDDGGERRGRLRSAPTPGGGVDQRGGGQGPGRGRTTTPHDDRSRAGLSAARPPRRGPHSGPRRCERGGRSRGRTPAASDGDRRFPGPVRGPGRISGEAGHRRGMAAARGRAGDHVR
jgi:hypothetical protein